VLYLVTRRELESRRDREAKQLDDNIFKLFFYFQNIILYGYLYLYCYFTSTITQSLPLRPKTSGEYISSALAGGTMNMPGVVARAI